MMCENGPQPAARTLYSPAIIDELMDTSDEERRRIEKLHGVLSLMENAMAAIRDVQAGRVFRNSESKS